MTKAPARAALYRYIPFSTLLLIVLLGIQWGFPGDNVSAQSGSAPVITNISATLVNIDRLDIMVSGTDANGDVARVAVRLIDGLGREANSTTLNIDAGNAQQFNITITLTGLRNLLGACNAEVTLIDRANNSSGPRMVNYKSCTTPILRDLAANPATADSLRVIFRGGDPDANTRQASIEIRGANGAALRGPENFDIGAVTMGQSDFAGGFEITGISRLTNPRLLRVQLVDSQGNRSETLEAAFTPPAGSPDLVVNAFSVSPTMVSAGGQVSVQFRISNEGDAPAAASNGLIRLSTDATIDSNDMILDRFSVPMLNSRMSSDLMMRSLTIPMNVSSTTVFIGASADTDRAVMESNEDNNTASQSISLQNVTDNIPPTVSVTAPRAGDSAPQGSALQIAYTSSDNVGVVAHSIDLSVDGGTTFAPIAPSLGGGVQQFVFMVPRDFLTPSRQAIVRVTARDAAGNLGMARSAAFSIGDLIVPSAQVVAPAGGETLTAGSAVAIRFTGMDNDALTGFIINYSTDGGATFPNQIGVATPMAAEINWNIPDNLVTTQGRIQVTARDRSGNTASAMSGVFSVQRPAVVSPILMVSITFTAPPSGQIAPPQNVRATAMELRNSPAITVATELGGNEDEQANIRPNADTDLIGFNIFRVPQPPDGQPLPTPDQIVNNPANLVGSVPANMTSFVDPVSIGKGNNFVYSITSFFGGGMQSMGSMPAATDLPVIRNAVFRQGTIFIDATNSFIKAGAVLIVNDTEIFPLMPDASGALLTVNKKMRSMPGNVTFKKLAKKGTTVRLTVRNPDGKVSVGVNFMR